MRYFYAEAADDAEYKYYPFLVAILEHFPYVESPHDTQVPKEMKKTSWLYAKEYVRCGESFRTKESYLIDTIKNWIADHLAYEEISEEAAALILL